MRRRAVVAEEESRIDVQSQTESRALDRALRTLPEGALTKDRRGFRIGPHAGLIDAGAIQIEVLPKFGSSEEERRTFLLSLLRESGLVTNVVARRARVHLSHNVLLEAVVAAAAQEVAARLSHGVPRRYEPAAELAPPLRGRIDIGALARALPTKAYQPLCRIAPLQRDNPLTRVLRAFVQRLARVTSVTDTRQRLFRSSDLLRDVRAVPLTRALVEGVSLGRFEAGWEGTLDLALACATGLFPDPVSADGTTAAHGLLFPLNSLFERVLRKALREAMEGTKTPLFPSAPRRALMTNEGGKELFKTRPDFLFGTTNVDMVGDAKWKRLAPKPDEAYGLRIADSYQVAAYLEQYGSSRAFVFFPQQEWMGANWSSRLTFRGGSTLTLVGVDVVGLVAKRGSPERGAVITNLRDAMERA